MAKNFINRMPWVKFNAHKTWKLINIYSKAQTLCLNVWEDLLLRGCLKIIDSPLKLEKGIYRLLPPWSVLRIFTFYKPVFNLTISCHQNIEQFSNLKTCRVQTESRDIECQMTVKTKNWFFSECRLFQKTCLTVIRHSISRDSVCTSFSHWVIDYDS